MKERDFELTNQADSPTLNRERVIFMAEPGQGEQPPKETGGRQAADEHIPPKRRGLSSGEALRRAQAAINLLNKPGNGASIDEKSSYDTAVKGILENFGIPGMAGGEDVNEGAQYQPGRIQSEQETGSIGLERAEFDEIAKNARDFAQAHGLPEEFVAQVVSEAGKELWDNRRAQRGGAERPITVPESLEDLAKLIMKRAGPEWRRDGAKSLIREDGRVNTVNFLDWTRQNLLNVHNANPTDPVNFFSDIGTSVRTDIYGGTISFYEITFGKHFFLRDAGQGHKVEDQEYEELRTQVLMETFLLMLLRNPDITYVQGRGVKDQVLKSVSEAYLKNPITRGKFLEFILTLPSVEKNTAKDLSQEAKGKELKTKKEDNFFVGNAVRRALATYINIYDYQTLTNILGADAPLFSADFTDHEGKLHKSISDENKDKWFNKNGSVKMYVINEHTGEPELATNGNGQPHPDYMRYLNVFLSPMPSQEQQSDVRERIKLSIMKKEGISYREADLAELFAFSMTHIHGVSARNDTDSVAFDWWTRMTNFKDYRKRQKAERRGAKYGNNYNLEGLKRIGLDYFEAARDINGKSIRQIIQGGENGKINMDNSIKGQVEFNADLQKQFVPNHLQTAAEMYDWLISSVEMDFPSMVTGYDARGNAILDWKKVNEVKEKIEHDVRYSLSTWSEINYDEENVEWERVEVRDKSGRLVARKKATDGSQLFLDSDWYILDRFGRRTQERDEPKTFLRTRKMTRLESMFGTDAIKFIQYEIEKRGLNKKKDVRSITDVQGSVDFDFSEAKSEGFRIAVWRGVFDYLIASEIASHRDRGSGFRYYNYEDIKKAADVWRDAEFLSTDEIKRIRKKTGTRAAKTYGAEISYALATGGLEGFWNAFRKVFLPQMFK